MGNITALVTKMQPAVIKSADFKGEKSSKNAEFVDYVAHNNILTTIEAIKSQSPIPKEMVDNNQIKIVGAFYSLKTGEVTFL